jgi:hypothetical protein
MPPEQAQSVSRVQVGRQLAASQQVLWAGGVAGVVKLIICSDELKMGSVSVE